MNIHGRRRVTRREAEQLLADPGSSRHALGPLLDAARSSQARSDSAGEDAAAAAFVAARAAAAAATTRRRTRRPVTKTLAATGLAVSMASGGVALAATGHLPDVPVLRDLPLLPDHASDRATESVGRKGPPSRTPSAPSRSLESPTSPTPRTDATATPTPSLVGLCRAYQAKDGAATGKALDSAAFRVLVTAAGGGERVAAYCLTLVGQPKPDKPASSRTLEPERPEQTGKPHGSEQAERGDKSREPDRAAPEAPGKPSRTGKPEGAGEPGARPSAQSSPTPQSSPSAQPSLTPQPSPSTQPSPTPQSTPTARPSPTVQRSATARRSTTDRPSSTAQSRPATGKGRATR